MSVDDIWKNLFISGVFMAIMLGVGYWLGYGDGKRHGK
jgi:hypothetical protein